MRLHHRLAIAAGFIIALSSFWFASEGLRADVESRTYLSILAQVGGPLAAAVVCFLAARRSVDTDRSAWLSFGAGSTLYLAGNLGYVGLSVAGVETEFPSVPEAAYFAMAGFFAIGMLQYAKVRDRLSRVQLYNFVLIYCAVTLGSLFTLAPSLASSVLSPFGTIAAFLYPAVWFSVASTGLISLVLYDQGRKSFPIALMLLAILAESIADYSYVLQLMDGTYQLGGLSQVLWVASAGLIAWAGIEHMSLTRAGFGVVGETRGRKNRGIAQATVPAAAIATILLAGSLTGALGSGPYVWLAAVLTTVLAVATGLREHWIIYTQRRLRSVLEESRNDLERHRENLRSVLESTSDSVMLIDHDWKVVYFNQRAVETMTQPGRLRIGASVRDVLPTASAAGEGDRYRKAVDSRLPDAFEVFVPDLQIWLGINLYPTQDGLSVFFRDISEQRRVREEIAHMAHHDPLTGLGNRLLFQERLGEALATGQRVATLLIDLDHFKEVNDTLGHPVGDAVLVEVARRVVASAGDGATTARLGGDEFAIILRAGVGRTGALLAANAVLEAARAPFDVEGLTIRIGCSVGIAFAEDGDPADLLFKKADIALYVAKSETRGGYRVYEPAMELDMHERQALRADLAEALARSELDLVYQPLLDLNTDRVSSFEALLRWKHPVHGMVSPAKFIPIAEDSGLMIAIGDWVLRTACLEAVTWPKDVKLAVNLSSRQFIDVDLADKIALTLEATGLEPGRLELEITESVLLNDDKANLATLQRLRRMGIGIALDDFGTGYSSLGYLQRFPFSKIKIDRSFVDGLPENEESQAIVRAVIGLGRSLGMRVTAEGVETELQLDWIRNGCDEAQGYLLGRPVAAEQIAGTIAEIDGGRSLRVG